MTQTVVDGVVRRPENGVKVVVIGAGVAGLQVALECWRNGCDVEVIERADGMSSVGRTTPSSEHHLQPAKLSNRRLLHDYALCLDDTQVLSQHVCRVPSTCL